jgi:CubicO group peptidase (beta-lactamase class C family)
MLASAMLPLASARAQAPLTLHPHVQEAIRLFDTWLEADVAYERVPGLAIGVVADGQLLWARGYGFADTARRTPVSPSTPFSLCSISKLFTATAVLQLRDAGTIALDDPVGRHVTGFNARRTHPLPEAVTVRRLLTHASGLPRDFPFASWTGPEYPFPTRAQVLESLAAPVPSSVAGSRHDYSNVGMTLAGELVQSVSGLSFEEYVRRRLFEPLGMTRSFTDQNGAARSAGLATGFSVLQRDGSRLPIPPYEVRGLAPVAGIVSTVEDMARFAGWQVLGALGHESPVLRASSVQEMQAVQFMPADSWTTAGYGFQMWRENDRTFVGHAGTCPGAQSQLLLRPQDHIAVIVLSNALGVETGRYAQRAHDVFAPAIRAASEDQPGTGPASSAFEGMYQRPLGSESAVMMWQGRLAVRTLPSASPLGGLELFDAVADSVFRRGSGASAETIAFRTDAQGRLLLVRGHQHMVRQAPLPRR